MGDLIPGDLVFYAGSDGTPSAPGHVVIYIGNGECVEAAHTGTNVMVTTLPGGIVGMCRPAPNTNYDFTYG